MSFLKFSHYKLGLFWRGCSVIKSSFIQSSLIRSSVIRSSVIWSSVVWSSVVWSSVVWSSVIQSSVVRSSVVRSSVIRSSVIRSSVIRSSVIISLVFQSSVVQSSVGESFHQPLCFFFLLLFRDFFNSQIFVTPFHFPCLPRNLLPLYGTFSWMPNTPSWTAGSWFICHQTLAHLHNWHSHCLWSAPKYPSTLEGHLWATAKALLNPYARDHSVPKYPLIHSCYCPQLQSWLPGSQPKKEITPISAAATTLWCLPECFHLQRRVQPRWATYYHPQDGWPKAVLHLHQVPLICCWGPA